MIDTIRLPSALCHGHIPMDLSAPQLRLAVTLIGLADGSGRIDILKPRLERLAGVRMDNAYDRLGPIGKAKVLNMHGDEIPVFDNVEYVPGEQKRLAGLVWGYLSSEFRSLIGNKKWEGRRYASSQIELARLTTAPGIALWLYLLPHRDKDRGSLHLRLRDKDVYGVFGPYAKRAVIKRNNADGKEFRWTSLSRMYDDLVSPAVTDLWTALDGWIVDTSPGVPDVKVRGRAWSYVDITLQPVQKRPSLREVAKLSRQADAYELRKHVAKKSIKSEQSPADRVNTSVLDDLT